jgi:hypothetical protein
LQTAAEGSDGGSATTDNHSFFHFQFSSLPDSKPVAQDKSTDARFCFSAPLTEMPEANPLQGSFSHRYGVLGATEKYERRSPEIRLQRFKKCL